MYAIRSYYGMAAAILLMALVPITTDLWKGALDRSLETETISEIEFVMPPPASYNFV